MKRKISLCLACVMILSLCLVGCAAKSESAPIYDMSPSYGAMEDSVNSDWFSGDLSISTNNSASVSPQAPSEKPSSKPNAEFEEVEENFQERKIVYSVNTSLQTKDLDGALELIKTNLNNCGGYIQSEELTNNGSISSKYQHRNAYLSVRVPSQNLENFLSGLENENLYTISLYKDSQDYSEAYYDKETRIANLRIQETRLLELLESASDIKTMLEIEERLSNIRYEIESLTKDMNIIDSKVAYSSVTIRLSEVVDYDTIPEEPISFFEEIKEAIKESWDDFVDGCQDFVIWLIYAFPTLLIWAIIIVVICIISRRVRKKRRMKKESQTPSVNNDAE